MGHGSQLAERAQAGTSDTDPADPPPRALRNRTSWLSLVTVGALAIVALGLLMSAITVVARLPFGDAGVVLPSIPVTTTSELPPPPISAAPNPPPATHAPLPAPPRIAPSAAPPAEPSDTPPPLPPQKPSATHPPSPPSSRSAPSSVHPTTHRPFPQETTDFLGPPGTNA